MAEAGAPGPESRMFNLPHHLGAMLEGGRNTGLALDPYTGEYLIDVYKVYKKSERRDWMFQNLNVFSDGTVSMLELPRWRLYVDDWIADLRGAEKYAIKKTKQDVDAVIDGLNDTLQQKGQVLSADAKKDLKKKLAKQKKEITEGLVGFDREKDEDKLKAFMSVSASARGMENSAATPANYVGFMTGGNLDNAGTWGEYLLHGDDKKLSIVLNDPLVRSYYMRLLTDAGYDIGKWGEVKGTGDNLKVEYEITYKDLEKIKLSKKPKIPNQLTNSLKEGGGGFDKYIKDVLLDHNDIFKKTGEDGNENPIGVKDEVRMGAAKLACDAFLVDKYTRWENELEWKKEDDKHRFIPSGNWDGNPFGSLLKPSLLPGDIKQTYSGKHSEVLRMIDYTFYPQDIFEADADHGGVVGTDAKPIAPSAVMPLKNYSRLTDAMWIFFGKNSRAIGLPQWNDDGIKAIIEMEELLDTVYGPLRLDKDDKKDTTGKKIVANMVTRAVMCKTMAAVVESQDPNWKSRIQMLFGSEESRPFDKIRRIIWGKNLNHRDGLLASMAGGRTQLDFENALGDPKLRIETLLRKADELLITNDQGQKDRSAAILASYARAGLGVLTAGVEVFGKKR